MIWQDQFVVILPFILAIVTTMGLSVMNLLRSNYRERYLFSANLFFLSFWALSNLGELLSTTLAGKFLWFQLHNICLVLLATIWFAFIYLFTDETRQPTLTLALMLGTPIVIYTVLAFTNSSHQLLWTRITLQSQENMTALVVNYGWIVLIYSLLLIGLMTSTTLLLIRMRPHAKQQLRKQINILILIPYLPIIGISLHLGNWKPYPHFFPIPWVVFLCGLISALIIFQFQLGKMILISPEMITTGLSDGLLILNAENCIMDINPAARIVLDLENQNVIGKPLKGFWATWENLFTGFQQGKNKGTEISFGTGFHKRSYDVRISNSFDQTGEFACRIVVLSDISDLKQAQADLQNAHDELEIRVEERTAELALTESRYRSVMEQSVDAIFLVDLETRMILEANSAFQELLSYSPDEIQELTLNDFVAHDREEIDSVIARVTERNELRMVEGLFKDREGTTMDVEVGASLISYGDRQAVCVIARDIRTRKKAEKDLEYYAKKQAIVAELGQQALAGEHFWALLDTILKQVIETLKVDLAGFFELQPVTDELRLNSGVGWNPDLVGTAKVSLETQENLFQYAIDNHEVVFIKDHSVEDRFQPSQILQDHDVRTSLIISIRGPNRPYGVLGVHTRVVQDFSSDDIYFLKTVANVLASTMSFENSKAAIEKRNREILALQTAGTAITSSLELEDVLRTVARETAQWLGVAGCAISEWDPSKNILQTMIDYGPEGWIKEDLDIGQEAGNEFDLEDYPHSKLVLSERAPLQMTLGDPDIDPAEKALMLKNEISTLLMLPMIFQERVIGMVEVMDDWAHRKFTDQEIAMGQLLANQAASAIENARLFKETQQRLSEQTALREAISAISSALDLETVLSQIVEQMSLTIDSTSAYVCIIDPITKNSTVLAEYISENACAAEKVSDLGVEYEEYDPEWLLLLEADEVVTSHIDDPEITEREREDILAFGGKSVMYVPLLYQKNLLGFVEIWESRCIRDFTPQEIALCKDLARNAAIAINNARLFKQTQKRLAEQTALREAITTISSALDLEEVLKQIVKQMALSINATSAYICTVDPGAKKSTVLAEFIGDEAGVEEQKSDLGVTYVENEPEFLGLMESDEVDTSHVDDPELAEKEREHMLSFGAKSILYVPLLYQDKLLGFVEIWETRQIRDFKPDEIVLCKDLARNAAIAVNNARLYQQAQSEINERKLAEQALERYARELEQSNKELEQFAYVASHDLQEPLRMVTSYVQLLDRRYRDQLDEEASEFIGYAAEGAKRMQCLIHDLLNYSRIGAQRAPHATIDSQEIVQAALKNLQGAMEESRARVTYDSLPTLRADAVQLTQLFQNLISNAIKFRCERPLQIHICAERDHCAWKFAVKDNGIGMDPKHKDRIFLIFQRLHPPDKYPGTGVGLAICKRIVERHGGKIWMESDGRSGSTFYFTIPIVDKGDR